MYVITSSPAVGVLVGDLTIDDLQFPCDCESLLLIMQLALHLLKTLPLIPQLLAGVTPRALPET